MTSPSSRAASGSSPTRSRPCCGTAGSWLNEAIFDQVAEINARPFQKREDSRWIVFQRDEKPLLTPLPPMRFELADLRKAKVAPNYHISLDRNYYSVPSKLIGQSLDVRVTSRTIEVFDGAERVACHPRFTGVRGRYSTVTSHMPAGHRHWASRESPPADRGECLGGRSLVAAWLCIRPARAPTASTARMWARIGVALSTCLALYAGSLAIVGTGTGATADCGKQSTAAGNTPVCYLTLAGGVTVYVAILGANSDECRTAAEQVQQVTPGGRIHKMRHRDERA